ncbi:MAG: hypothetical protein ACOY2B_00660 [Pseudomonadota bacterium]|jgi:hypothetical protein
MAKCIAGALVAKETLREQGKSIAEQRLEALRNSTHKAKSKARDKSSGDRER